MIDISFTAIYNRLKQYRPHFLEKTDRTSKVTGVATAVSVYNLPQTQANFAVFSISIQFLATKSKYCHIITEMIQLKDAK